MKPFVLWIGDTEQLKYEEIDIPRYLKMKEYS